MLTVGQEVMARLDEIAACSVAGPGVTRLPFTSEHRGALELLQRWMQNAGLSAHLDAAGTLIGRREGSETTRTLIIGSHQDSVPNGGKYDGILGVVLPIVVLEQLKGETLPFSVEVVAFADEEGVRFPTALMGPRALAGTFDPAILELSDRAGMTLGAAMREFDLNPDDIMSLQREESDVLGFVEVHIEQGPVLQELAAPVGIVTDICGIERWAVVFEGRTAHAGTTPMELRLDALAGASEIVVEVERLCRQAENLVGVVGQLDVHPNAVNAVPGSVQFVIELRSGEDDVRRQAAAALADFTERTAARRRLSVECVRTYQQDAVPCDSQLCDQLERAAAAAGLCAPRLMSGATHDTSAMADLCPTSMLFVRCLDGISHNPSESITANDSDAAARVLRELLLKYQSSE